MRKIILLFLSIIIPAFGDTMPILEERDWTSKDGRVIKATLVKAEGLNITLKMAKDNKIHTLELERFSDKDRNMVSDNQEEAANIIEKHNSKVKNLSWYVDWHYRNNYASVPELEIDELYLIYYFGDPRDLGIFAVKFTLGRFRVETDKTNAVMMGTEGFGAKAKTAAGWSFLESGRDLKVRPKANTKGSSANVKSAYVSGVTVRMLFPNGRSITEGHIGIEKCLLLTLENFEPHSVE